MRLLLLALLVGCQIEQGLSDDKSVDTAQDSEPYDPYTTDSDMDGTVDAEDCEPYIQEIHPGAAEECDEIDNDCDDKVDEGFDQDDDGYKDIAACYALEGEWDCDDADPAVHPGADEVCDGQDNNCDGGVDDIDEDADGISACTDCDDEDAFIFPGAAEACDAVDNNCNGGVDEGWDEDGDGYSPCQGDCDDEVERVNPAAGDGCDGVDNDCNGVIDDAFDVDADGLTSCAGDCDDDQAAVYPGHAELCDGMDNDCDASTVETIDGDGDGFSVCTGDCEDTVASAYPGGTESCDGVDNDCSGHTDDRLDCYSCTEIGNYVLCTDAASWDEAEDVCEGLATSLAVVDDSTENSDIVDLSGNPTWIGATDMNIEGTWTTPDGVTPIPYDRWESGEPDGTADDCALLNTGGRRYYWADATCSSSYRFICEY